MLFGLWSTFLMTLTSIYGIYVSITITLQHLFNLKRSMAIIQNINQRLELTVYYIRNVPTPSTIIVMFCIVFFFSWVGRGIVENVIKMTGGREKYTKLKKALRINSRMHPPMHRRPCPKPWMRFFVIVAHVVCSIVFVGSDSVDM